MKITIITVCFNSEKTIKDTLESVLSQNYTNFNYIIKDGLSTDNTSKIIQEYIPMFKKRGIEVKYISSLDNGLYDAMNQAIAISDGDIIGIINSDDIIQDNNAFFKIVDRFNSDKCDAVYSDLYMMDYETMSNPIRVFIAGKKSYKTGWYPPHPTLYIKRNLYNKYGNYNTNYKIAADYDFMIRIMKNDIKMSYIEEPLIYMRAGGTSTNSLKSYIKSFNEGLRVLRVNNIKFPLIVNIFRTLNILKQRLMAIFKIKYNK